MSTLAERFYLGVKRVCADANGNLKTCKIVGLTGLEPVTLRLSSACSNQLSYRPIRRLSRRIVDFRFGRSRAQASIFKKSEIGNRQSEIESESSAFVPQSRDSGATAPKAFGAGGKGIRTPDFQLAKLALYQLSYAPRRNCRISIGGFRLQEIKAECRMTGLSISPSGTAINVQ